jgi:hypothetical protein
MKKVLNLLLVLGFISLAQLAVQAQTAGAIGGTVVDPTGAVIPNATVAAKSLSGKEFTANTSENGTYKIPAVPSGIYSVSVTATRFKTTIVTDVKVDAGVPSTVDLTLEPGSIQESVVVASGAEVLQTQTAAVSNTVIGRQITETPIASRDALDLVLLMPGTNTVGAPRRTSIMGLPKGSLSITIDGVDVQDNLLRSSDGYFTYVRPRVDAIEEVTVSTANPGAESGGDGAVQIKFVTRRGTNAYSGGGFYQRRHESMNANYWYNNRNRLPRSILRLNQYGGHFGGPIPLLKFGEGRKGLFDSGKDKAHFFVNYEEFRLPDSLNRQRTILTPSAQAGNFSYIVGGATRTVNLLTIAGNANASGPPVPGRVSTIDPTVALVLARIRESVGTEGTITPVIGSTTPNTELFNFSPKGNGVRKFLATRFDFNVTKSHSVEFVMNRQEFVPSKDFLNSQDERFPGFPWYTQGSTRNSYSFAVRSTFGGNIVNEARVAASRGFSSFSAGISPADFAYSGGNILGIDAAGITTPYSRNSSSGRTSPTTDFTDSVNWIKGTHTINFGGQYKRIGLTDTATGRIVPTISFGIDANETALVNTFNTTTIPGATTAQLTTARNLYATLIGHVTGFASTAYLTSDGTYKLNAFQAQYSRQDTYGLFIQDSWKIRPNLSLNFGLRWQPQGSYVILSDNYSRLSSFDDIYGVSGVGNLFKPGTLSGRVPTVVGMQAGENAYPADTKNFGPSVGVVWSPNFGETGFMSRLFGGNGKAVFRGGYSKSFVREGTALIGSILGANPGGTLPASRTFALGNLSLGTNLRDAGNPNLTPAPFSATPAYPITLSTAVSANVFDPNLKTGSVHSFSFGYQRELDQNTVIELRYAGNRGVDLFRQHNLNEFNTIENGLAAEFKLARQNLLANVAANRCQTGVTAASCQFNFAYFGPGTGTVPLPISLAYITGIGAAGASNAANYQTAAAALFRNTAFATNLSRNAPNVITFGGNLEGAANRRANALAAGLPANFFFVNPTTATGGAFIVDNSARSWYDGGTIEVRRRLSKGLRVNANYSFAKAQSDSFQSNSDNFANFTHREGGRDLQKGVAVFDIRHAFKLDATYDAPFGRGRKFLGNANKWLDAIVGGFTIAPVLRWQSGSPIQIGNVQLVGMTSKELTNLVKIRKEPTAVFWLPDDIIQNSIKAFNINPLSADGYGLGVPTGKFIAPAGFGDCQSQFAGQCGFANLVIYGPSYFKLDASVAKKIKFGERTNLELRVTSLDVLNRPNFRIGGWGADVVTSGCCGSTFGQLGTGSAYQDVSTTNDPGGRIIDLMIRLNW